jgi:hypothetical protein
MLSAMPKAGEGTKCPKYGGSECRMISPGLHECRHNVTTAARMVEFGAVACEDVPELVASTDRGRQLLNGDRPEHAVLFVLGAHRQMENHG